MDIPTVIKVHDEELGIPVVIDNPYGRLRVSNATTGFRPADNYMTDDLRRFRGGMLETASLEDVIGKDYAPVRKYLR